MRVIANIFAAILIFFGVLFVWGAFSPQGQWGWVLVGVLSVVIGLAIVYLANRPKAVASETQAIRVQIDLPADLNLDILKCQSCGGNLRKEDIQLAAGSVVIHCPYCNTVYQLTEEPKW